MITSKQISNSLDRSYRLSNSFLFLDYIAHIPAGKKSGKPENGKQKS